MFIDGTAVALVSHATSSRVRIRVRVGAQCGLVGMVPLGPVNDSVTVQVCLLEAGGVLEDLIMDQVKNWNEH